MTCSRTVMAAVLASMCGATAMPCFAQDTVSFRATAVGPSERQAVMNAYFEGLRNQLSTLAGAQAQTGMGTALREEMARDFEAFRHKFFTADTDYRCSPSGSHIICEVEGGILAGALSSEMRSSIRTTEQTLSNSLVFTVAAASSRDVGAPLVVDKLSGAFAASGHKLLSGSAINQAIEQHQVDYSLAIQEVAFGPPVYIIGERRSEGNLTVRFSIIDVRRKLQVAVVPVVVTASLSSPSVDSVVAELRGALADKAAMEISRQTNNAIVATQEERPADQAGLQRRAGGQVLYLVQLQGIAQRNRDVIRAVREALSRAVPAAQVQVDAQKSSDTQVTIAVTTSGAVAIDSLIDALYATQPGSKTFEAISTGTNQIKVRY
jgi:hypothetical protein